MRMSTKSRFAVNTVIDLALREAAGPVVLASIAQRQRISLSYLEQLFGRLKRAGIVDSTRGPGGGFTLGRCASEITVADIVRAVDDAPESAGDGAHDSGKAVGGLDTRELWAQLEAVMLQHMAGITLDQLVEEQRALGVDVEVRARRRAISPQPVLRPVRTTAPNSVFALGSFYAV
jgi:Rrf2 family iron-sulfur cluster assembly transcriptional regulator